MVKTADKWQILLSVKSRKKSEEKVKKVLTFSAVFGILIRRLSERSNAELGTVKSFEKAEKLLDKRVPVWYNKIPL